MNTDTAQKEWTELKGKIKARWDKLVDQDIDTFKDNMHLISEKVQHVYGVTKDKAEQEYADFKKTLDSKVTPEEKSKPN